jgi:hypothetical protein
MNMVRDASLRARILEHCSGEFKTISPLIGEAAPKTTLYRCKDELLNEALLESDGRDRYRTTAEGMLKLAALKGESPRGLTAFYSALAEVPTPQHKAIIELATAAIIARKFNLRSDRHPTIVIVGPTLSWKTSAGIFLCHMHGLDPSTQVVNMAAESGRSLWLRRTSTGAIAYKRELLATPFVVFDEYQSADQESKRLLRIWMDGRKNVAIENEKLTIEAAPLLTLNPSKGESLENRLGLDRAQLRRSITCDLTGIKLPNLAMKGEGVLTAAKNQPPLNLVKPSHDLTKYRPKLYDLFTATLNEEGQELADLETLTMLSTAMTAYFEPDEAIQLVFYDALLLFETLGWTRPGWPVQVKNFPTGTQPSPAAGSSDPKIIPEETWAEAFKFLDEGGAATELVIRYHLPPDSALTIAKKHNELKAANGKKSGEENAIADPEALQLQREVKLAELKHQKAEHEKPFEIDKKIDSLQATMTELQTTISDLGRWKKEHCIHFIDNYCRHWFSNAKPALPYQIGEPLQKDEKWYMNPNYLRCAACPEYHQQGTRTQADLERRLRTAERRLGDLTSRLDATPMISLRERFQCESCGSKQLVAVKIRCTKCGYETWWGWHPQ